MLQKAMVFTLAAAMLVGTPLSASAAGLLDLYQTEDGKDDAANNSNSNSNTDTNTDTNTNTGPIKGNELKLELDQASIDLMGSQTTKLTARLVWDGAVSDGANAELEKELLHKLEWNSSDKQIVEVLKFLGNKEDKEDKSTVILKGRKDGQAVVTVSLDDESRGIHCKAEANVNVYRYATKLLFNNEKIEDDAYTGNSLVLDEYVNRYVNGGLVDETADTLTFTLVDDGGRKATLKNGVLKLNKVTESGRPVKVVASGKNVSTTDFDGEDGNVGIVVIKQGTNATKLTFAGDGVKGSKLTHLVNNKGTSATVTATVSGKKGDKNKPCTDKITWSSANEEIVKVVEVTGRDGEKVGAGEAVKFDNDKCSVELKFYKAGNTQVIGTVSSGKTFKLNVSVSAELTGVTLAEEQSLYTGQIIDLNDMINEQRFSTVTDAVFTAEGLVKWEFTDKKTMSKVAKLNAKTGVLEILQDRGKTGGPNDGKITIKATNAKKCKCKDVSHNFVEGGNQITFDLLQVNISSIEVRKNEDVESGGTPWTLKIENGKKQTPTKQTDSINVSDEEPTEYILSAKGTVIGPEGEETALSDEEAAKALAWTASGNGKTIKAWKEGDTGYLKAVKKGSATITVSGVTRNSKNGKFATIKATFKDTVNAPSQNIKLSVKNSYIPAVYKKGQLADLKINNIKFALDKGTTTKNKKGGTDSIVWTATLYDKDGEIKDDTIVPNLGKVTIPAGKYAVGDKITVNARVENTGASDSITLTIVYPTKKVVIKKYGADGKPVDVDKKGETVTAENPLKVCAYIESSVADGTGIGDGSERAEMASYTVSGKGAVYVMAGKDGELTIYPLRKEAANIKFVMTDGKTATLKVNVTSVPSYIEAAIESVTNFNAIFENIVFE
ncbi:MAG: hypothetical protein K2K90_05900 [Lachnospiraceae bacterium]|nr:hypothetical protein [Lachnospiraceae bacterium]